MTARAIVLLCALALVTGCGTFDPAKARQKQTQSFTETLRERHAALPDRPLSLADCVRMAVSNNYAVRLADLDKELAGLGKSVAFSSFVPRVAASVGYTDRDYDNLLGMSSSGSLLYGPQNETASTVSAALPIFAPSTWFLYAAARHGYAAAEIAAFYTRQNIVLQTTAAYCDVLVQRDTVHALETQLEAATRFADRLGGFAAEGIVADWEQGQAQMQAMARRTELDSARRRLRVLEGRLLQTMGLSPDAGISLSGDFGERSMPEGSLEDLVLRALETHPQLAIADRRVVMREHEVRQAFCNFLPTLSISATHVWGGEDLSFEAMGWMTGFQGAWTLFSGFANTARYRAAKTERRRSELERENAFLSVIVAVMAAEAQVRDAREAVAIRQKAYDVFSAKYADRANRAEEGLLPVGDALDARAEMDLAQVALIRARYAETTAIANLELAMGITLLPEAEPAEP